MTECRGCGRKVAPIDTDSDEWCDVLDTIKKYADMSKEDLVLSVYADNVEFDEGGETKTILRKMTRGELLVRVITSIYGG